MLLKMPADPTKLEMPTASSTVREYYESWIEDKRPPKVRPAQARDYRRQSRATCCRTSATSRSRRCCRAT